jgi:hypothetical protein
MARLIYEIGGDVTGLENAINQGLNLLKQFDAKSTEVKITVPDISPQFRAGIAALDQLGEKLLVVQGNTTLFGESVKLQSQEVAAYQSALNSLLANGFDPMDADVQRLKQRIDDLTQSLKNIRGVQPPGSFINDTSPLPSAENVARPDLTGAVGQQSELISQLNQQLAQGTITTEQYNQALLGANSTLNTLSESTANATGALESEIGIIAGMKQALADLNSIRLNTLNEQDLPKLNAEIQQTEFEIKRLSNIGKEGFDSFGNAIKGVSVQNVNGQLISLSNNLFGARQISRDLVRTLDAGSISGFAKAVGLLAVDFLFFAQNAQFARTSTIGATAAIAAEGEVAAGSALTTGALGAAFSSLLTPTSLIVLGIAAAGAAFIAYEKSQKTATETATEHLKALREQKQALADYVSTLTPAQQVEANAAQNYAESTIKLEELVFAVKNNTGAIFDGKTALEDLQKLYPVFFANIDEAASKTDKFTAAANAAKESLQALGEFQAANKLAQQFREVAVSNQAAANSLLKPLTDIKTQLDQATESFKKAGSQFTQSFSGPGGGGASSAATGLNQLQVQYNNLLEKIKGYNQAVAEANQKTQSFIDIANSRAPKAGLVTVKPEKDTADVINQFDTLKQKLDEIIQKNSALAGNNGLKGYAADVADIVKQFTDLNNAVSSFAIQVNKAFERGALTASQRDKLLAPLPSIKTAIPQNEDAAINQAKIKDAQATADAIQKINDQFGIKEQAGFNEELSRIKKLYDSILEEARKSTLTRQQIEENYQRAVQNAQGNSTALANAKRIHDAQVQQAQDADARIVAAQKDILPAILAVDEKYIQQEQQTYGKIIDIANQAFEALDSGEASRTDKINLEWQKRITSANAYFDKLRDLAKAANLPQSSTDNINTIQAQVNVLLKAANAQQVSVEISKPFADALQGATDSFVKNFYDSLTGLGQARQTIDDKYFSQLAAATDQATINQINSLKKIEQQATTSFGAIFSSLVSKFSASFNQSILSSFTKQLTENLGKTLIAPTDKQLTISPEEQAAQNVADTLKNAGNNLAEEIKQAGVAFANSIKGASINPLSNTGVNAKGDLVPLDTGTGSFTGNFNTADFGNTVTDSASTFSNTTTEAATKAGNKITSGGASAGQSISDSGNKLSLSVARAASALSIAGGIVSGVTSPTSTVGQGIGGALSGAGEGALIGSAIAPGIGTLVGAVGGFIVGGISGIFGASKAKKQEELQQKQLEQQKLTNELLARQNALAYTSSIIGRMTQQGIVTGVDLNSFGELTATVSGKDLQFVLGRAANGR